MKLQLIPIALIVLTTGTSGASAGVERTGQGPITVDVKGSVVIGFFPPFTKAEEESDDGGISEGLAHLEFALEDISKCYGSARYRLDITRSITLRDGKRLRHIRIPRDWGHSVGLVFAAPGRSPRVVFAVDGPSSLTALGPPVAAEYFGASACRDRH